MQCLIISGIGTGIGKTFISAIFTEAFKADYWKPIQAGNLNNTDTDIVRSLVSNQDSVFHPEAYRLSTPASPHAAAALDNVLIDADKLLIPATTNTLIIETAGGLMVPLNNKDLNIDLIKKWNYPVVLVSKNYLGSINHTLLSIEACKSHNIKVCGIIFNGKSNLASEKLILDYTGIPCIAHINEESEINSSTVKKNAFELKKRIELKNNHVIIKEG